MQRGKAVVGIKKLDDAAVPFGLLASGMLNEVGREFPLSPESMVADRLIASVV